jgi:DNA-binding beta-propeller fold protein YncE
MRTKKSSARIGSSLLCLAILASASFAATNPLANPFGMAVDAKGNLWVANGQGGDSQLGNILVFNSNYVLQTKDTITSNLNTPLAVAFDPDGNLWVANNGPSNGSFDGSIAEYIDGKQNTAATITDAVLEPFAMAIDGYGDIFVGNQFNYITVYETTSALATPTLAQTLPPTGEGGIAITAGNVLMFGSRGNTIMTPVLPVLTNGAVDNLYYSGYTGVALASDNKGHMYIGNLDGSVYFALPTQVASLFVQLSFAPTGIAVDNVHGRVYISNGPANTIYAYSTAGELLKTIQ